MNGNNGNNGNKEKNSESLVAVGLSGGVDSAVSAYLLKQAGYRVIGLFMKNWDEKNGEGHCTAEQDFQDVVRVCEVLDIPYYSFEFVGEYFQQVFKPSLEVFLKGETPNPDVWCNKYIKFGLFYERALSLGVDYIATGHYCRRSEEGHLRKGLDPGKDQSYFLYTVKAEVLKRVLFPIGGMLKREVRQIAKEMGLVVHDKKDSTGICFIGERDFAEFLGQFIKGTPGPFKTSDGKVVGEHQGVYFYTLGQRKGLGLGGAGEPWFVVAKDIKSNSVFVERGDHPLLFSSGANIGELTFVEDGYIKQFPYECKCKVRYRQEDQECIFEHPSCVRFKKKQRAVTPGQSIVFYDGEVCIGGGVIETIIP
ncbi:MAG: tRNA 2-thiouridine(34) synthase MnmA [Oligoflexia bacterium]|nr:tRNA 2-thiouridine(34) synthase MnmA [Oligoflexia bacterium]MBF0364967.1 tRNA 2-thiouridine(34) synthase MnmA [Oligoflexia bacterium]